MSEAQSKVCLIVGSTTGIGKESAEHLAKHGWTVVVSGRSEDKGKEVAENIIASGGKASFHPVDVTSAESVAALHAHVIGTHGRLDAAINNAGMSTSAFPFASVPVSDFDKVYSINQRGLFICMQEQIRIMMKNEKGEEGVRGRIVNMSSTAGLHGLPFAAAYSASKHAVMGLTKTAALEYGKEGILVTAIAPAFIDSGMPIHKEIFESGFYTREQVAGMHPVNRIGRCTDVAKAVLFLLENTFVTGSVLEVDGGMGAE